MRLKTAGGGVKKVGDFMKLSELNYLRILEDMRLAFLTKAENRTLYFNEVKRRLETGTKAIEKLEQISNLKTYNDGINSWYSADVIDSIISKEFEAQLKEDLDNYNSKEYRG